MTPQAESRGLQQPTRGAGWFHRSTAAQHRIRREIVEVLKSDLYRRWGGGGSEDEPDEPCYATWVSPLKWSVDYGCNLDGETMWARAYGPDHRLFAADFDLTDGYQVEGLIP